MGKPKNNAVSKKSAQILLKLDSKHSHPKRRRNRGHKKETARAEIDTEGHEDSKDQKGMAHKDSAQSSSLDSVATIVDGNLDTLSTHALAPPASSSSRQVTVDRHSRSSSPQRTEREEERSAEPEKSKPSVCTRRNFEEVDSVASRWDADEDTSTAEDSTKKDKTFEKVFNKALDDLEALWLGTDGLELFTYEGFHRCIWDAAIKEHLREKNTCTTSSSSAHQLAMNGVHGGSRVSANTSTAMSLAQAKVGTNKGNRSALSSQSHDLGGGKSTIVGQMEGKLASSPQNAGAAYASLPLFPERLRESRYEALGMPATVTVEEIAEQIRWNLLVDAAFSKLGPSSFPSPTALFASVYVRFRLGARQMIREGRYIEGAVHQLFPYHDSFCTINYSLLKSYYDKLNAEKKSGKVQTAWKALSEEADAPGDSGDGNVSEGQGPETTTDEDGEFFGEFFDDFFAAFV